MTSVEQELSRGWKIHQQGRFAEAEQIYRSALKQASQNANAWCYLGIALHDQRHYGEAVSAYRHALELRADFPVALNNLGNSLRYIGGYEEADQCFQRAAELKPDYVNAYKNRGTLHVWTGNLERGQSYYAAALKLNADDAELHRNLGVIYLLQSRFEEGWREYRWRWQVGDLRRPAANIPLWKGEDLRGKTILLTAEQGLGDTLHFVRFATRLKESGAETTVYCQSALLALLQCNAHLGPVYPDSLPLEQTFDYQCSLIDVADVMRVDLASIPAYAAYLQPASNLIAYWSRKMPRKPGIFRVGIAWQGNPDHQADAYRSIPLRQFECLAEVENIELVSLQNSFGSEQIDQWRGASAITRLESGVDKSGGAFMDTAAIMHSLDLVITSDTAIAHLAAAMGLPTWIALGYIPDWRWLLDRSDSPWYPSVRLFRQPAMGDWSAVFEEIKLELGALVVMND